MKFKMRKRSLIVSLITICSVSANSQNLSPVNNNQIQDLVQKMTVEEKTAQLECKALSSFLNPDGKFNQKKAEKLIPNGIGQLVSSRDPKTSQGALDLQKWLQTKTRLGIQAIIHGEAITGTPLISATTLPQQIGMGCTWNPELLEKNTAVTSTQMRQSGMNQALSPMIDVGNNARWGRNEEGFGEDPYLTSRMGLAFIQGMQGTDLRFGVAATVKHFAGYAQDKAMQEKFTDNPTNRDDIAVARYREDVLTPFEVAVKMGNVASVMPGYHSIGGVRCSASKFLLTDILRNEWGFKGDVVSDYGSIKPAKIDTLDALVSCLSAGVDVDLPGGDTYKVLPNALAKGLIDQKLVDQAVSRILSVKDRLGLLDKTPIAESKGNNLKLDDVADRKRAYQSACQSLILLKNSGVLPLSNKIKNIAVIGPNANSSYSLLGDYTPQTMSEFWGKNPFDPNNPKLITLLAGLKNRTEGKINIEFERGCDWVEGMTNKDAQIVIEDVLAKKAPKAPLQHEPIPNWENALAITQKSDLIIVAVGENRFLGGETRDRKDVSLPGKQQQLVKELIATGKPVVLVLFGGRANAIGEIAGGCQAIVQAWYPGEEGGNAVADLLLGNINPSGKLTFTMPANSNQCPIGYRDGYNPKSPPLFPFGHGLSFTSYIYGNLTVANKSKINVERIPITFSLTNSGAREGVEIAQLYVSSPSGIGQGIAIELKGFARVNLHAGETRKVTISLSPQQLALFNTKDNIWEIKPGKYAIKVGTSSTDLKLSGEIELTGETQLLKSRTVFFSETSILP